MRNTTACIVMTAAFLLPAAAGAQQEVLVVNPRQDPVLVRDMTHAPGASFVKRMAVSDQWQYTVPLGKRLVIEHVFVHGVGLNGIGALAWEVLENGQVTYYDMGVPLQSAWQGSSYGSTPVRIYVESGRRIAAAGTAPAMVTVSGHLVTLQTFPPPLP